MTHLLWLPPSWYILVHPGQCLWQPLCFCHMYSTSYLPRHITVADRVIPWHGLARPASYNGGPQVVAKICGKNHALQYFSSFWKTTSCTLQQFFPSKIKCNFCCNVWTGCLTKMPFSWFNKVSIYRSLLWITGLSLLKIAAPWEKISEFFHK